MIIIIIIIITLKEKSGSYTRKTFNIFIIENITHTRRVLQCETRGLSGGGHRCFKRSTGKKRPFTRDNNDYNNNYHYYYYYY
jgi:hypothetical protein